jgi:hypothetical protein
MACTKCAKCLKLPPNKPKLISIINQSPPIPKQKPLIPFPFYDTLPHNSCPNIKEKHPRDNHINESVWSMSNIPCSYFCSQELCDLWKLRYNAYENCKETKSNEDCRKQFGCKQWEGFRYRYTAPLPPYLTDCEPCWINNFTNI